MDLIITDFIKCFEFWENFEEIERYSSGEMKAVGLPEMMDIKGGHEQILMAEKNEVRVGVEKSWPLPLTTEQEDPGVSCPYQQTRPNGAIAASGSKILPLHYLKILGDSETKLNIFLAQVRAQTVAS